MAGSRKSGPTLKKLLQPLHCRICQDIINEPNEAEGDDSVQCNGLCDGWIHRHCAGLSLALFEEISRSDDPFFCPSCCAAQNQAEIISLKSALASLTSEVSTLKASCDQIMSQRVAPSTINDNPAAPEQPRGTQPSPNAGLESSPKPIALTKPADENRKFNLVVYGIEESASGTPGSKRMSSDFESKIA